MKRHLRLVGAVAAAASLAALIPLSATPAGAVSEPEIVAEGLNNPYKMSFGPDGALYVAEAGTGPTSAAAPCVEFPEGGDVCIGLTGSVTRIDLEAGTQERVATELPSLASSESGGDGAIGPVDVAVDANGNMFVVIGQGGNPAERTTLGPDGAMIATIVRVSPADEKTLFADLGAFEATANPDADQPDAATPDTNPFAIEVNPAGGFWAVDAGGNDVLNVSDAGVVTLEAVLPFAETDAPPFLGLPPGTNIPYQPVPTSITNGPGGLLVTQLTGFPFPPKASNVFDLDDETGELTIVEAGFTNVVDLAQGPDGSLYVLEFSTDGLLNEEDGPPTSRLTQVRADGTRKVLLQDELFVSNGVAVGPDGMVYVSNGSQVADEGSVIRVDPNEARDPAAAAACDPEAVPGAGFEDVGANVHREAIDCLAWWGIIEGKTSSTFDPGSRVRRDQMASIVARLLEAAGVSLPADAPDAFTDDEGSVHEGNINALAALDVISGRTATIFAPGAQVTRGQAASLLARAYAAAAGVSLADGTDAFTDDDGTTHEENINAVATAGWVNGTGPETFNPNGNATRAQLSSMVARMLGTLVEEGTATLPT